jgi:hypothetical protein
MRLNEQDLRIELLSWIHQIHIRIKTVVGLLTMKTNRAYLEGYPLEGYT